MSEPDVSLKFGADISELVSKFSEVKSQMEGSFSGIASAFKGISTAMAGIGVALAGGAAFEAAIEETNKMTMEAIKLGKQLGITATEASYWAVAMDDVHVSAESVNSASQKITRTLITNENAFKNLGVATRDNEGKFRSTLDIMLDVNKHLAGFKEGIDRNIEGQKIYGRQWSEIQGTLRLTTAQMEKSKKTADELGLVVGEENVKASMDYRAAMNDVGDVMSGMGKVIGDAIMPVLTQLGEWFAEIGPGAIAVLKTVLASLMAIFYGFETGVRVIFEALLQFSMVVGISFKTLAAVIKAALTPGESVKKAWDDGAKEIADAVIASNKRIVDSAMDTDEKIRALTEKPTPIKKKEGGDESGGNRAEQLADWKQKLEEFRTSDIEKNGIYHELSKKQEEAYWADKLAIAQKFKDTDSKVYAEVAKLAMESRKAAAKEELNDKIADLETKKTLVKGNAAAELAIVVEELSIKKKAYGEDSEQYKAAARKKLEFDKQQKDARIALEVELESAKLDLKKIGYDAEKENNKFLFDQGKITKEALIGLEADYVNKVYAEDKKLLDYKLQQDNLTIAEEMKLKAEIAKLNAKHANDVVAKQHEASLESTKVWRDYFTHFHDSIDTALTDMIMGTKSFAQAVADVGEQMLTELVNIIVKNRTAWLANELTKTTASVTGDQTRTASSNTAASIGMVKHAGEAVTSITTSGVTAGAGATAESAPYAGWGALAIGAGVMAAVLAMTGNIKSSAGGEWRVDRDRLNVVHKDETILPASIATPLRNAVEGGGGLGGGAPTFHIHAMDSHDVKKFFDKHGSALVDSLRGQNRNFNTAGFSR